MTPAATVTAATQRAETALAEGIAQAVNGGRLAVVLSALTWPQLTRRQSGVEQELEAIEARFEQDEAKARACSPRYRRLLGEWDAIESEWARRAALRVVEFRP